MTYIPQSFTDVSKSNWKPSEGTWLAAHEAKDAHTLVAHTLKAEGHDASEDGTGRGVPLVADVAPVLGGGNYGQGNLDEGVPMMVADTVRSHPRPGSNSVGGTVAAGMAVRRLTPVECERLQGFPHGWTEGESDSARYRMLGNAVCVPVAEWIGRRIVDVNG